MRRRNRRRLLAVAVVGVAFAAISITTFLLPAEHGEILFSGTYGRVTVMSDMGDRVRVLGHGGTFAVWSADGARIASSAVYRRDDGKVVAEIWTIDPDVGGRRVLASGGRPLWSPDGSRILFVRTDDAVISFDTIWTMDVDGSHPRLVARGDVADWSPDGKWLAYATDDAVLVVAAIGGPSRVLSTTPKRAGEIHWSPDGRWVLAQASGMLFLIRSDGSAVRTIAGTDAAWSPDGRRIAYVRPRPCLRASLYAIDVEGTHVRRLTRGDYDDSDPSWAPDGDWIAFSRRAGGLRDWRNHDDIYVVSVDDGTVRRLTRSKWGNDSPEWRPRERRRPLPRVVVPPQSARPPVDPPSGQPPLPVLQSSPPLKPRPPVPVQPSLDALGYPRPNLPATISLATLYG